MPSVVTSASMVAQEGNSVMLISGDLRPHMKVWEQPGASFLKIEEKASVALEDLDNKQTCKK